MPSKEKNKVLLRPFTAPASGNIAYVLIGFLASSGAIAYLVERNVSASRQQSFAGASDAARDMNLSALNLFESLVSVPGGAAASSRNPAHVPAIFPDNYVNSANPNLVRLGATRPVPASAATAWSFDAPSSELRVKSPDFRFAASQNLSDSLFDGTSYAPSVAAASTRVTGVRSVSPVFGDAARPFLITAYRVTAESTVPVSAADASKGQRRVATTALVNVDPPPSAQCDMEVSTPASQILNYGATFNAALRTFGVVVQAWRIVTNQTGASPATNVLPLPAGVYSVRNSLTGGYLFPNQSLLAYPSNAAADQIDRRTAMMNIGCRVTGPNGASLQNIVQRRVYKQPVCSLSANPVVVATNGTTTLILSSPDGAVDRYSIPQLGRDEAWDGTGSKIFSWNPGRAGINTITATVFGPGGTSSTCSATVTEQVCRFQNSQLNQPPVGMVVPRWDNNFHQPWPDWVTAGGTCSRAVTFRDRTCVPCPRGDLCGRYNPSGAWTADGATFWRIKNYYDNSNCWFELGFIRAAGLGCFAKGTMITMADGSRRQVEVIKHHDKVFNPLTRRAQGIKRIVTGAEDKPLLKFIFDSIDGIRELVVTDAHPFLTRGGFVAAAALRSGDTIISSNERSLTVREIIQQKTGNGKAAPQVWNIELDTESTSLDDHMLEADGVMTGDLFIQERLQGSSTRPAIAGGQSR